MFGEYLREQRLKAGDTQHQLARRCKTVDNSAISKIEKGGWVPRQRETIEDIGKALGLCGVELEYFHAVAVWSLLNPEQRKLIRDHHLELFEKCP